MAWSTRELAELAGTTVNTIRHYHRLGLLEEPERRSNGYKQYGVHHLVCLLRVRRLVGLGVPLAQIDELVADGGPGSDVLRRVDAELAAELDRLRQARSDIAAILRDGALADAPAGFGVVAARLTSADTSMLHIYSKLYDDAAMQDLRTMVEADNGPVDQEFDGLPADADEATRRDLAGRLAPILAKHIIDYPWLSDPASHVSAGEQVIRQTVVEAVVALYNAAQVDVLGRASVLAQKLLPPAPETDVEEEA
ncbi:MerR family transcriptional regulator [Micromonospora sp. WMMD1155]|uniref:MerR family transcriptional regulator n=1 Tax=Micromonospora sp. WMMD1155 TaxID=3016094 RepID=UPI00249C86C5|nr:MerR family transcriptional regulator [Micromonospora sp. WMMD1155]WFE53268.1 MerR family transcriptional regulator [Micromonospora sp. WMMD1155]